MSKKNKVEEKIIENIVTEPLDDIMGDRYGIYAKYVIQDRAIPDARDGLKPVQRRIVYSMWNNNNTSKYKTRKCAKIVGDVIGKYHPHGDTSVYEALARMSQDWKVRMPLVTFQGNNGSIDGDPPAAYRYTEAKLSELADELVRDLNKESVNMNLTYDDSEYEPSVLPARFPNLYVNGAEGIAVGLATEIPPHNLKEIVDAIIYRINRVRVTSEDLMQFVKGPDFPTGAKIINSEGLKDIYLKGRGRIDIVSKTEIIEGKDFNQIIISEIPYKTVKKDIVFSIDQIRHDKLIDGIIEVRDETDRNGLKIVIDTKKNINPDAILKYLLNKTSLKVSYYANIVAIIDGHPRVLSLLDYVDCYINHQVDVITRISTFDLNKCKHRLMIVEGLLKAIDNIDETISIIRKSLNKIDAKTKLEERFTLNKEQSEAIVMMPIYKLSHTDIDILKNERLEILNEIDRLNDILNNRNSLNKVLISDLRQIVKNYSNDRRTEIIEEADSSNSFDKRDLINKEDVVVTLTKDGYIKRCSLKAYNSNLNILPGFKEGDSLVYLNKCSTLDYIVGFTNLGNYFIVPVHKIIEGKWKDEGKHLNTLISYNSINEKIIKVFSLSNFRNNLFFTLISKKGQIKRTFIDNFMQERINKTFTCMKLFSQDELKDVILTTGNDNLIIFINDGEAVSYNENCVLPTGVKSGGIKACKLDHSSKEVAGILSFSKDEKSKILILTDHGHTRIFDNQHIEIGTRLSRQYEIMPTFKNDPHSVIYVSKLENKEKLDLYVNTSLKGLTKFEIVDFYLTPLDKYAKTNLDILKKDKIISIFKYGETISDSIISTYKEEIVEEMKNDSKVTIQNTNEKGNEKITFTQVSIFENDESNDSNKDNKNDENKDNQ